jgi:hypothetical protein
MRCAHVVSISAQPGGVKESAGSTVSRPFWGARLIRNIPPVRTPEFEPRAPGWRKIAHRPPVAKERNNA